MIRKKRIRNVDNCLSFISEDQLFYVVVERSRKNDDLLLKKHVCNTIVENETFIPSPIGPSTMQNIEGKKIVRKDLKKEIRTIYRDYHTVDWQGNDHYGTCIEDRLCYPVDITVPKCLEITVDKDYIRSTRKYKKNDVSVLLMINIMLEIFGEFDIVDDKTKKVFNPPVKRLPWIILPKGEKIWPSRVEEYIKQRYKSSTVQHVMTKRCNEIKKYNPDYVCVGDMQFYGYVVFCFEKNNIYVLESNHLYNATYVFKDNWKQLSKLTKKELIKENKYFKRLIHNKKWENDINILLKDNIIKK